MLVFTLAPGTIVSTDFDLILALALCTKERPVQTT